MKNKLLYLTVTALYLCSCNYPKYPKYVYEISEMVPDSLKAKEMLFITETMRATDFHLSTSDYEDPEDVIRELRNTYEYTHKVPVEGLTITACSGCLGIFVPYHRLNDKQKIIFEHLQDGKEIK